MISDETLQLAQRLIQNARIKGQKEIEIDQVLQDVRCTFKRGGLSIKILVVYDQDRICCYQQSSSDSRRPAEQRAFLAFSRQICSLQELLERRLNAPVKAPAAKSVST